MSQRLSLLGLSSWHCINPLSYTGVLYLGCLMSPQSWIFLVCEAQNFRSLRLLTGKQSIWCTKEAHIQLIGSVPPSRPGATPVQRQSETCYHTSMTIDRRQSDPAASGLVAFPDSLLAIERIESPTCRAPFPFKSCCNLNNHLVQRRFEISCIKHCALRLPESGYH